MICIPHTQPPHPPTASMPSRHGEGGGGYSLLSRSTFDSVRFVLALCVFFCHVFERFNDFGFLFVSCFIFMSGFGLDYTHKRFFALNRILPYLVWFVFFSLVGFLFYGKFPFPSYWFFVLYFICSLIYRFSFSLKFLLFFVFLLEIFFISLDFSYSYYVCLLAFPFGVFVSRFPFFFTLKNSLLFLPFFFLVPFSPVFLFSLVPVFCWLVCKFFSFLSFLSFLGVYSFYFFALHCFLLAFFGSTWCLGGSVDFWGVFLSFVLTCFLSWFLHDFVFRRKVVV